MISYRITKYDPKKRNDQGHYLDNSEWTSISDIGKPDCNNTTFKQYERIENLYLDSIMLILKEKKISNLTINSLELNASKEDFEKHKLSGRLNNLVVDFDSEIKPLKDGIVLNINQISKITRLILRETIWMLLINSQIEIRFGYDYYMYVTCEKLSQPPITWTDLTKVFRTFSL
jgi:hypothetical protein